MVVSTLLVGFVEKGYWANFGVQISNLRYQKEEGTDFHDFQNTL